jgi:hypothetical protein
VQFLPVVTLHSRSEPAASVSNWILGYALPLVNGPTYLIDVGWLLLPLGQSAR